MRRYQISLIQKSQKGTQEIEIEIGNRYVIENNNLLCGSGHHGWHRSGAS
tara:strand:+ start:20279 stop:20428 length:150 start_codon:yes stop_codon:yes gene_type:complete